MTIDNELLKKLETLSYLNIDDSKRDEIMSQLSEILSFVDNLSELDTEGLQTTFNMINAGTTLREDIAVDNSTVSQSILANAPKSDNDFFIVDNIIE